MNLRIKITSGVPDEVQQEINSWLEIQKKIEVIDIKLSSSEDFTDVLVFYRLLPKCGHARTIQFTEVTDDGPRLGVQCVDCGEEVVK